MGLRKKYLNYLELLRSVLCESALHSKELVACAPKSYSPTLQRWIIRAVANISLFRMSHRTGGMKILTDKIVKTDRIYWTFFGIFWILNSFKIIIIISTSET